MSKVTTMAYVASDTFTVRDLMRLFALDKDLSLTFVREPDPDGPRLAKSRLRLALKSETQIGVTVSVEAPE